jgi:polysaccharide export outer membrane protein
MPGRAPADACLPRRAYPAIARAAGLGGMLALCGCTGFIPSAGPRMGDVMDGAHMQTGDPGPVGKPKLAYALVTLDPQNVMRLGAITPALGFDSRDLAAQASDVRIGIGDVIGTTIFEAQSGGLFIPAEPGARSGNYVQLPPQQVNREGTISVPFGGSVRAVGLTPAQLQTAINASIASRALEPQSIVTIQDRRANEVTVTGDVNSSVRFGVDPGGERMLGAIARAGGPRFPSYETMVTLQRGARSQHEMLADILQDPRQNIQLHQGDTIIVTHNPRYFLALGAVGQSASFTQLNRRFPFEDSHLTMADAIARAGGLQDDRANPQAVFLFRFEHPDVLRSLGLALDPGVPAEVPTVYRADFTNASTLFLAQNFQMRDNDMIFVSNAPLTDWQKFLSIILPFAQSGAGFRAFNP